MGKENVRRSRNNQTSMSQITVGVLRSLIVPDLKTYMDLTKTTDRQEFQMSAEQWEKSQSGKRKMFKQVGGYKYGYQCSEGNRSGQTQGSNNSTGKRPLTCF